MSYLKSERNVALAIVVVTSLFCLHLVRNIFPQFPYVVWVVTLACSVIFFTPRKIDRSGAVALAFLAFAMAYSILMSFVQVPNEHYLQAIGRFGFVWPYAFFVLAVLSDWTRVRLALQTFAVWVAIAGATILMQTMFGEVNWFALPAVRDSSIRYASLAGSLTIFGIVGGFTLPIVFFFFQRNPWLRSVLFSLVSLGLLLGLQKASIVNLCIFIVGLAVVLLFQSVNVLKARVLQARDGVPILGAIVVIVGFSFLAQQDLLPKAPAPKMVANSGDVLLTREKADLQRANADAAAANGDKTVSSKHDGNGKQGVGGNLASDSTGSRSNQADREPTSDGSTSSGSAGESGGPNPSMSTDEKSSGDSRLAATASAPNTMSSLKSIVGARDDGNINEGLRGRLVQLPAVLFQKYGVAKMLAGVGLVGGAGALGFTEVVCDQHDDKTICVDKYPLAHNGYIELLALGGVVLLVAVLTFIGLAAFRIYLSIAAGEPYVREKIAMLFALVLFCVNIVGGAAILYQPYFAVALYLLTMPAVTGAIDARHRDA